MSKTGLLLVGHGTRSAAGTQCVERLCDLVADRLPDMAVRHCFLELNDQTIRRSLVDLVEGGVSKMAVVPLLLFAAGHAKADIPREIQAVAPEHVDLVQAEALGCHAALVQLSQQRCLQAVGGQFDAKARQTCLLLVGRGSHDVEATAEMHRFADLRGRQVPGVAVEVAFIAMVQPSVGEVVAQLTSRGFGRVIVQPHLLFPGELLDNLEVLVANQQAASTDCDWLLAPPLAADLGQGGPADRLLIDAVVERAMAALKTLTAE